MPRNQIDLLLRPMGGAYRPFRDRLEGLTGQEMWWEPVPGAWTLRHDAHHGAEIGCLRDLYFHQ